jgi:hypothetical protein
MALWNDLMKSDLTKGIAIGVAATAVTSLLAPALAGVGRPLARTAIKTGIILYERGRELVAEMGETFDDLVAEVRAELSEAEAAQTQAKGEVIRRAAESKGGESGPHE